jgi:hypothetical protein
MKLELNLEDEALTRFGNQIAAAGEKAPLIMAMALNKEGNKSRTEIIRAIASDTGLKPTPVRREIKTILASPNTLAYELNAKGKPIALKYFNPKEVKGGVSHTSKLDPNPYPGGFLKVGGFLSKESKGGRKRRVFRMGARRATSRFGGQVMENTEGGKWAGKVQPVISKVRIDKALVEGASKAAFERCGPRVIEEVGRLLGGYLTGTIPVKSKAKPR